MKSTLIVGIGASLLTAGIAKAKRIVHLRG